MGEYWDGLEGKYLGASVPIFTGMVYLWDCLGNKFIIHYRKKL